MATIIVPALPILIGDAIFFFFVKHNSLFFKPLITMAKTDEPKSLSQAFTCKFA